MTTPPQLDRYQLRDLLGRGGMGEVWRAWDPTLEREVALKLIVQGGPPNAQRVERFRREAEALARVQHPHVIRIHDAGVHAGRPYLVMELIQGASLQDSVERGPLDPRTAASLVAKLADALQAVHEAGLLHRDIKPDNVLLRPDGDPLLTDFGLALHAADERLTRTGAFVGTPGYLPPEQAAGERARIDARSDVYALGAVLYACLTGAPPHGELDPVQALLASERLPQPPSSRVHGLPPELDAICMRCLHPRPRARYADARALANDLQAFLAGEVVRGRRLRWSLPALAVGLGLAAVGGVFAWNLDPLPERDVPRVAAADPAAKEPEPAPEPTPPTRPAPGPPPAEVAAPVWESAEQARDEGLRLVAKGHWARAIPALEFAFAADLPDKERIQVGSELCLSLFKGKLDTPEDLARAERQLPRARALYEELTGIAAELDTLDRMPAEFLLYSEVYKPLEVRRSRLLSKQGQHSEALRVAEALLPRNPDSPLVTGRVAECLLVLGRPQDALNELERLWSFKPDTQRDSWLLERAYDAQGQLGRWAEQDATAQALCDVSDNPWFFHHALRVARRGPYDEALERYRRLDERLQRHASTELGVQRALLAYQLGLDSFQTSNALCDELLKRNPTHPDPLRIRAQIALLWNQPEEALELAERALRSSPTDTHAQLARSEALLYLDRQEDGLRQVRRALSASPALAESSAALYVEARCLLELGREAELRAVCERMRRSPWAFLRNQAEVFLSEPERD